VCRSGKKKSVSKNDASHARARAVRWSEVFGVVVHACASVAAARERAQDADDVAKGSRKKKSRSGIVSIRKKTHRTTWSRFFLCVCVACGVLFFLFF